MAKMIAQFRSFRVRTLKTDATMSIKPEVVFDGNVDVDVMKCGGNSKVMARMAVAEALKREYIEIFKTPVGKFDFDNAVTFTEGDVMYISMIEKA
ncbi:MAG: hypothetical protein HXP18_10990 [Veillonella sp.]|nr:hypothetical protein [Veillonella sp.]